MMGGWEMDCIWDTLHPFLAVNLYIGVGTLKDIHLPLWPTETSPTDCQIFWFWWELLGGPVDVALTMAMMWQERPTTRLWLWLSICWWLWGELWLWVQVWLWLLSLLIITYPKMLSHLAANFWLSELLFHLLMSCNEFQEAFWKSRSHWFSLHLSSSLADRGQRDIAVYSSASGAFCKILIPSTFKHLFFY